MNLLVTLQQLKLLLIQVDTDRFETAAVLHGGGDINRKGAPMHRTTGADGTHAPVFDDLGAQHGQLQHLAALDDLMVSSTRCTGQGLAVLARPLLPLGSW